MIQDLSYFDDYCQFSLGLNSPVSLLERAWQHLALTGMPVVGNSCTHYPKFTMRLPLIRIGNGVSKYPPSVFMKTTAYLVVLETHEKMNKNI